MKEIKSLSQKIKIKPLSVNKCWQGKRFKTKNYLVYEKEILLLLKPIKIENKPIRITFEFGLSNLLSDWDNPVKPIQDVLQKKFNFNDRYIMEANVKKVKVNKGDEYVYFNFEYI